MESKEITVECTNEFTKKFISSQLVLNKREPDEYEKYFHLLWENTIGPIGNTFTLIINKDMWEVLQDNLLKYWQKIKIAENTYEFAGNDYVFKVKE